MTGARLTAGLQAQVLTALAQGQDLEQVRRAFGLTPEELQDIFREAARRFPGRAQGWRLCCDGAARGNPGPAGAGAVLFDPQGDIQGRVSKYLGEATNNVAEYQALIEGLRLARSLGVTRLRLCLDSQLVVNQLNGSYRVKTPHLLPLWRQAKDELQNFEAYAISHIPREKNALADRLANEAIDRKFRPR